MDDESEQLGKAVDDGESSGESTAEKVNKEISHRNSSNSDENYISNKVFVRVGGESRVLYDPNEGSTGCSMALDTDFVNKDDDNVGINPHLEKDNSTDSSRRGDIYGTRSHDSESVFLTESIDSLDQNISRTDENPDGKDRFDFENLNPSLQGLCVALDGVNFIPIDCPNRAYLDKNTKGSPNIEMNENHLLDFFKFMSQKIGPLKSQKMLDVGSGYGMPSFIGNHFHSMPSLGVEISSLHVRTSLMMLVGYRQFMSQAKLNGADEIFFIEKDLMTLTSFNPYTIVYAASIG